MIILVGSTAECDRFTERFMSKLDRAKGPDGCWPFMGAARNKQGHGAVGLPCTRPQKVGLAHRLAWTILRGPIPAGMLVLHKCDNPPCCNPSHLYVGTHADNSRDMRERGRGARGERIGSAKLTDAKVLEIRALAASGMKMAKIARANGVCPETIYNIVARKKWKHVPETSSRSA